MSHHRRPANRANAAARSRLERRRSSSLVWAIEPLETRTLLSALPAPTVLGQLDISGAGGDHFSPSIAINPVNPNKIVAVFSKSDAASPATPLTVGGVFSSNGGASWTSFNVGGPLANPLLASPTPFPQTTDPTVAWDRNNSFYIVTSQHTADNGVGAIVLNKYGFSLATPSRSSVVRDRIVYAWTADAAVKPVVVVDANVASFTDPNSSDMQTDDYSGNVYVAWASVDQNSDSLPNFNPNVIRIAASSDGGLDFTGPRTLSDAGHSASPQLVVSQNTVNGIIPGGQVTAVWDELGATTDQIKSDRITDGAVNQLFDAIGGVIGDNTTTTFPIDVSFDDPRFLSISDVEVRLAISHASADELSVQLMSPGGQVITLVSAGQLSGTGAGLAADDSAFGAYFDQQSQRSIAHAAAPYIGRFRPAAGSLDVFNGILASSSDVAGQWKLLITDNKAGNTGTLEEGTLSFTAGMHSGADRLVATTHVRGALAGAYPTASAASPAGIGPGLAIAADNTLGSFSPFQGRLYVAYVDRSTAAGNPADNTDVFVATSTDGGATWSPGNAGLRINSDAGAAPQFQPALAVDPTTGTLVLSWLDGRDDPAKQRIATYLTTSIDGGGSFGPQVVVNAPNGMGGPVGDNQSASNPLANPYGFGDHQGIAALNGKVLPVWSGNLDGATSTGLLDIFNANTRIAAGPRVMSSTTAATGSADHFIVTFDRPVDPATFTPDDVTITFRPPGTPPSDPGTPIGMIAVSPIPAGTADTDTFRVDFEPHSEVGTYSYTVGPVIRTRVRSLFPTQGGAAMDQNADGTPGQDPADRYSAVLTLTASRAFHGADFVPPVRIEAEDFDTGGEGVAYHDTTAANLGGAYRAEGVDIQPTTDSGGGFNVGFTTPGEFLEYSLDVPVGGLYRLDLRIASDKVGGSFHLAFDGINKTGQLNVPNTFGWQNWTTISSLVDLPAGKSILRLAMDSAGARGYVGNFNWLELTPVAAAPLPFAGTPVALPAIIQAEDYDIGGPGVSFSDSDAGGGHNVGWTRPGEFLEYSTTVATAGTYRLDVRASSAGLGGKFRLEFNGIDQTGPIQIPNTGGWQKYTTLSRPVDLPAGNVSVRLIMDSAGPTHFIGNFNWLKFTFLSPASTPFGGVAADVPGQIEAENFDEGGQGIGWSDHEPANLGGAYRAGGVDIQATADAGGGFNVGWTRAGEFLKYSVNVPAAGDYRLQLRVASAGAGGTVHAEIGGPNKTGPLAIPATGGFQNWQTLTSAAFHLDAGPQILKLVVDSVGAGGFAGNINWLNLIVA